MNWRYLPWVFPRQGNAPNWFGTSPSRFPSLFSGQFYPEGKGTGNCGPAASVRAAPPERHSTGRIAGPHRTPTSPRYSHATRTPGPTGRPPTAAGVGAERGRGRGHNTPIPAAKGRGGFRLLCPRALGPPASVGCRLQAFQPLPGRPSRTMVTYSIVRSGLVVELSEPLPGGAVRMTTPRMPPSRSSRHDSGDYRPTKQGGNRAYGRSPATLPVAGFLVPKRSGNFRLILNHKRINRYIGSVHFRMETLASIRPVPEPGRPVCLHRLKRCIASRTYSRTVKRLARLYIQRKVYRFIALPSGLKPAPRIFTGLVGCVAASSPPAGSALLLLPRRLAAGSPLAPTAKAAPGLPFTDSTGPGAFYQLGQVGAPSRLSARRFGVTLDIPRQLARPSPGGSPLSWRRPAAAQS